MKLNTNKRYNTIAFYAVIVIAVSLLMIIAVFKFGNILDIVHKFFSVLSPVIWGLVIAFLLNPIMVKTEKLMRRYVFKKNTHPMLLRAFALVICAVVFLLFCAGTFAVVIPEIFNSLNDIFSNISKLFSQLQNWISKLFKNNQQLYDYAMKQLSDFAKDTDTLITRVQPIVTNILSGAWSFLNFLTDFLVGFIISMYVLAAKEKMLAQSKKFLFAVFRKNACKTIFSIGNQCNTVFSNFVVGRLIECFIVGLMTFIGMSILKMPYAVMISVLVAITDIIPFFGPFLGAIPSALLLLMVDGKYVLPFAIMMLIIQQVDGNLISPKILGESTGLPPFWVLVSLFVGGGLFGVVGMILCVPTFAILYDLVRTGVESRLKKRNFPTQTQEYYAPAEKYYSPPPYTKPLSADELQNVPIPPAETVNQATKK